MLLQNRERVLFGELETEELGKELSQVTPPGGTWLLHGDLGSGKTTFTRGFVLGLGGDSYHVASPTYAIMHRYQYPNGWIHHLDLYRLGEDGIWSMGLDEIIQPLDYLLVEWAGVDGPWPTKWVAKLIINGIGEQRIASWSLPDNL